MAVQRVMARVLEQPGIRRALPGEFSQRAVLNGRLDLTRAEAIGDLVSARSQRAAQLAMAGVDGGIQRRIKALRECLLDQLSELEARVDFEDDLPALDGQALLRALQSVRDELLQLIDMFLAFGYQVLHRLFLAERGFESTKLSLGRGERVEGSPDIVVRVGNFLVLVELEKVLLELDGLLELLLALLLLLLLLFLLVVFLCIGHCLWFFPTRCSLRFLDSLGAVGKKPAQPAIVASPPPRVVLRVAATA